ncbi:MAG TPA: GNAT family N-acetyltransferase [Steroidobacteraceae bacterium]|nr:GNAT family N-acetyltransferase [Steroidobacteraceae bacterium]
MASGTRFTLRLATPADVPALRELIARSARGLSAGHYSSAQIEGALQGAFGVDASLIEDGTYFAVVAESGELVACGGWGRRRTLFGSSSRPERDESWLDPRTEAARIRAFFVDPQRARQGLARMLLERSESEARRAGFATMELMATLPGIPFYERCGYLRGAALDYPVPGGAHLPLVAMSKRIAPD